MTTNTAANTKQDPEQKIREVRDAFADAPEYARAAVMKLMGEIEATARSPSKVLSAGRIGSRQGTVSELTMIVPFAPGGARRLRALLRAQNGHFQAADKVGTLHDMRFVFLDNDTKFLFATAYDGDYDKYIDDFVTMIPAFMDAAFSAFEGWPGITSGKAKDWIAEHMVEAEGWYVANPDLTVDKTRRLERVGKALDQFLDKVA